MSVSEQSQSREQESSSPSLTRREQKRQAKRNSMLDNAMAIIVEGGLESLTIARLAKRLDAAVGALYRYFPGKQALLVALEHRSLRQFSSILQEDLKAARDFLQEHPTSSPQAGVLMQLLTSAYSYIFDAERAPTRHHLMDLLVTTPERILEGSHALEVETSLLQLLSQVAQLFNDAVTLGVLQESVLQWDETPKSSSATRQQDKLECGEPHTVIPENSMFNTSLPTSAWQRTYVMWSHLHGLDHFRKRDRILPPPFHVNVLFRTGLCALLQGWGASQDNLQEAFDLFEAFLPSWTQFPQE